MPRTTRRAPASLFLLLLALASACQPSEQRPGLWLSGEPAPLPEDWSFTDAHSEIAIEVRTPYGLPHSVTIWCAFADGRLFVAARDPEEKRWPGWVARDPEVRLAIDGRLYDAKLLHLDDPDWIAPVRRAYAAKYQLEDPPPAGAPPLRYWQVVPRG
ncbi:MAG: DUF2255 family protein [Myxococcales bacterium]|nr:MAG: DUF2255 family protein [Myxococcales bacterium]